MALFFVSCGGCNTSTAEGAADCMCNYLKEGSEALADGDKDKLEELGKKVQDLEEEVDKHVEAGDYTEDDLQAAVQALEGECG